MPKQPLGISQPTVGEVVGERSAGRLFQVVGEPRVGQAGHSGDAGACQVREAGVSAEASEKRRELFVAAAVPGRGQLGTNVGDDAEQDEPFDL